MLRASSELEGAQVDLLALGSDVESGVPHGVVLIEFADAIVLGDANRIRNARDAVAAAMDARATVDAAAVASNFQRMVRIADSTGIPLGDQMEAVTADARAALGLTRPEDKFRAEAVAPGE